MTLGFLSGSRNFCKLLWVSVEVLILRGYASIHWVAKSYTTTAYRWLFRRVLRSVQKIFSISNDSSQDHGYHFQIAGLRWTSSDTVSAYTQVKMEDAHKLLQIPESGCPDIWIRLPRQMAKIMVQCGKTQLFLLNGICMATLWQDYHGKGNLRKSYWNMVGNILIGNVSLYTAKKDYSYLCMWMTLNWLARNKILIRCGNYSTKNSIWEHQHLAWIMCSWVALNDNAKWAKILWTNTEPCLNQKVQREGDGAVQFWRKEEHLQSQFPQILCWFDDHWKACLATGGNTKML